MKLKYMLKKAINLKNGYLIGIILVLLLIIGGYFSYALFTVSIEAKGALNIVTGNLYSIIESTDLDKDKSITIDSKDSKVVTIKLVNANGIKAKVNLYYKSSSNNIEMGYLSDSDKAPNKSGYILEKNGSDGSYKTIHVKIINNDNDSVKVTFGTSAGLDTAELNFPSDQKVIPSLKGAKLDNIIVAYKYDQTNDNTKCITGEEETCQETKCYQTKNEDSCPAGTIIKYQVNDNENKYFNVISDAGETLLLQQRENTINNIKWSETGSNKNGPDTIISQLEEATKEWTNVNDLSYTINNYSLCTRYNVCTNSIYTMTRDNAKARLLEVNEAAKLNCTNTNKTCPIFMNNYLTSSTQYGGTIDTDNITGYWLMEAGNIGAWAIYNTGNMNDISINTANLGARAVVEINK